MNKFNLIDNILKQYENISNKQNLIIYLTPFLYHIKTSHKTYMYFYKQKIICDNSNKSYMYSLSFSYPKINKEMLIEIYIKILKSYNSFRKILFLYKKRKFETVIKTDLMLNTIEPGSKNVLCIIQNQKKYLFYIFELLKIIYNSLSNSEFFFSEPLEIKNPYNNLKFEYHNLCNIYFFMKFNNIQFNNIFYRYFKCNFDREMFLHKNFNYLRECSIKNYVYNNNENNCLKIEVMNMINNYNKRIGKRYRILIHEEFPMDTLYNIMKNYLYLYINIFYSYIQYETETFLKELNHRLFYFQKYNPQFGRLKYKIFKKKCFKRKRIIFKKIKTFDVDHINFMCNINMKFDGHYKYVKLHINYMRNKINFKNENTDNDIFNFDENDFNFDGMEEIDEEDDDSLS